MRSFGSWSPVLGVVALIAALAGCGGDSTTPKTISPQATTSGSELVVELTDEQLAQAGADSAEPYPAEILADKRITFAEYEVAVLKMVACAAEGKARLATGALRLDATQSYNLAFVWDPRDYDLASKAVDDCGRMYLYPVQELWTWNRDSVIPESTISAAARVFWECIEEQGIDIEDRPHHVSTTGWVFGEPAGATAVTACQERIFQEFGLEHFGG